MIETSTIELPRCPKCGGPTVPRWKSYGYSIGPASPSCNCGTLFALCLVCDFDWPVPALDGGGS